MPAYTVTSGSTTYTGGVWRTWTYDEGTGTATCMLPSQTSATLCDVVWPIWVSGGTGCTPIAATIISNNTRTTWNVWPLWVANLTVVPAGVDQAAALAGAERLRHEHLAAIRAAAQEGEDRARALLLAWLSPEQRAEFETPRDGLPHFHVVAASGRRYRIGLGSHGNVIALDADGKAEEQLCCNADGLGPVPAGDHCLAQKLMLECDEAAFRRLANIRRLRA
jgi:hypothetical protein